MKYRIAGGMTKFQGILFMLGLWIALILGLGQFVVIGLYALGVL